MDGARAVHPAHKLGDFADWESEWASSPRRSSCGACLQTKYHDFELGPVQATGSRQWAPGNGLRGERPLVRKAIGGLVAVLGSRYSRIAQAGFGHCDQLAAD